MKQLKLSKGLIAFGGCPEIGKSRFLLKLSNHLAETEKVLFVSYQESKAKLEQTLNRMGPKPNMNLEIDTSIDYFSVAAFLNICNAIKNEEYTTLIIDDLDTFNRNNNDGYNLYLQEERATIIQSLSFISSQLGVRVIFALELPLTHTVRTPTIRDFNWSREIINKCAQIFTIYRPSFHGITEDEYGDSLEHKIEVSQLLVEDEKYEFDNKKLKIYNE